MRQRRLLHGLGQRDEAREVSRRFTSEDCLVEDAQPWMLAQVRVDEAQRLLSEGDEAGARALLDAFEEDWYDPDSELLAAQTARALRLQLPKAD